MTDPVAGDPVEDPSDRKLTRAATPSDPPVRTGSYDSLADLTSAPADRAGQLIGDYRIVRELGRGGMGVVYEAEQLSLGRRVALKMLPQRASRGGTSMQRFRREARAAARLHHTNIVPVFEIGEAGDVAFFTMQYIQGQSLDGIIQELRRLQATTKGDAASPSRTAPEASRPPDSSVESITQVLVEGRHLAGIAPASTTDQPGSSRPQTVPLDAETAGSWAWAPVKSAATTGAPENGASTGSNSSATLPGAASLSELKHQRGRFHRSVAHLGRQAASALAHAHARGVVHRDIKPSNLMLDADGTAWITDFGLAKAEDDGLTQSGDLLGTIRYMAPERFQGQGDHRVDIYALGLTLYELATCRPAFENVHRLQLIDQIRNADPPRPRAIDPRIPPDLETIILKAIDKDPAARYQNASELGEDLRRFLADEPVLARRTSPVERLARWAKRNPAPAALGGSLATLILLVSIGSILAAGYYQDLARREQHALGKAMSESRDAIHARKAAEQAQADAVSARVESDRLAADLAIRRGLSLCDAGSPDQGVHWLLEALRLTPDRSIAGAVRWNLAAWLPQIHETTRIHTLGGRLTSMELSPDGRRLIGTRFQSPETSVSVWDAETGRLLKEYRGYAGPVLLARDRDVAYLRRLSDSKLVALDLADGRMRWVGFWADLDFTSLNASPDGSRLFWASDDSFTTKVVDARTGNQLGEDLPALILSVADDGDTLAGSVQRQGRAWAVVYALKDRKELAAWPVEREIIADAQISRDARTVTVVSHDQSYFGYQARRHDARDGKPMGPAVPGVGSIASLSNGDRLFASSGGDLRLLDRVDGQVHGNPLRDQRLSRQRHLGDVIPTISQDQGVSLIRLSQPALALRNGPLAGEAEHNRTPRSLQHWPDSLTPDGRYAIRVHPKRQEEPSIFQAFETATGRPLGPPLFHPFGRARAASLSPDRTRLAAIAHDATYGELRAWDVATGRPLFTPISYPTYATCLAFDPGGEFLAIGGFDRQVRVIRLSDGRECVESLAEQDLISRVEFDPSRPGILAIGCYPDMKGSSYVQLWDFRSGKKVGGRMECHSGPLSIRFLGRHRLLLAGEAWSCLFDPETSAKQHPTFVDELAAEFRPGREQFATGARDGTVRLRDATTGALIARLGESGSAVRSLAFAPDGRLLAVGQLDGAVRLLDVDNRMRIGPALTMGQPIKVVRFSADGSSVIAQDDLGRTRTWPVPTPLLVTDPPEIARTLIARTGYRMEKDRSLTALTSAERKSAIDASAKAARPEIRDGRHWLECRAREAEERADGYAAIDLLTELQRSDPGPWRIARIARATLWIGRPAQAAALYESLSSQLSQREIDDWERHASTDALDAGRWDEARWYLERLAARQPGDWLIRDQLATALDHLGLPDRAKAERTEAIRLGADRHLVLARAEELVRLGAWDEADRILSDCARRHGISVDLVKAWSVASVLASDRTRHPAFQAEVASQLGARSIRGSDLFTYIDAIYLRKARHADEAFVLNQLSPFLTPGRRLDPLIRGQCVRLLVRIGKPAQAVQVFIDNRTGERVEATVDEIVSVAMAHQELGFPVEANEWLNSMPLEPHPNDRDAWTRRMTELRISEARSYVSFDPIFPDDPFEFPGRGATR